MLALIVALKWSLELKSFFNVVYFEENILICFQIKSNNLELLVLSLLGLEDLLNTFYIRFAKKTKQTNE